MPSCTAFAAERLQIAGTWSRDTRADSFHILLNIGDNPVAVEAGAPESSIAPGAAVLIPGANQRFSLHGHGLVLDYYVPDLDRDVAGPLRDSGFGLEEIRALGCDQSEYRP